MRQENEQHQEDHYHDDRAWTLDEVIEHVVHQRTHRLIARQRILVWYDRADTLVNVDNRLYPSRDDFAQQVWLKLIAAREQLENIWNDPDLSRGGYVGVSRFVCTVIKNAFIDQHRSLKADAPLIFAASVDAPADDKTAGILRNELTFGRNARSITLAPKSDDDEPLAALVTDELFQPQAFSAEDLCTEIDGSTDLALTEHEVDVLYESIVYGATLRELAEERHESRSTTHRIAQSAKAKARRWIEQLRQCSYKEAKSHMSFTVGRVGLGRQLCRSLRPDKISADNAAEYHRLNLIERAKLFNPAISGELVAMLEQPKITDDDVAHADALKNSVAKDDVRRPRKLREPTLQIVHQPTKINISDNKTASDDKFIGLRVRPAETFLAGEVSQ